MIINPEAIERVFTKIVERFKSSPSQSENVVVQLARSRLSLTPSDLGARHVMAVSSLRDEQPEVCFSLLQDAASELPEDAVSRQLAGYARLVQKRYQEAKQYFDDAVKADPCQSDCWMMLGRISETEKRPDWAIQYYSRAIIFDRWSNDAPLAIAKLYARRRKPRAAIHSLRVALLHNQRSPKLNLALAKLLKRRIHNLSKSKSRSMSRLIDETLRCYKTAISASPTSSAFLSLGGFQLQLEQFDDASQSFLKAIELDPKNHIAMTKLADASLERGDIEDAVRRFEDAMEIKPSCPKLHFRYTRSRRFESGPQTDAYIAKLDSLLAKTDLPERDQALLLFALAKVHDDVGLFDKAWAFYDRANRLKLLRRSTLIAMRSGPNWPPKNAPSNPMEHVVQSTMRFFTRELLCRSADGDGIPVTPVFIVGMPRSGTTLTEQIVSCHPSVAGGGELQWIERIRMEMIEKHRQDFRKRRIEAPREVYPVLLESIDSQLLREYSNTYLSHLEKFRKNEPFVTDKMPTNFMHLGLISMLFPTAKIIHCRRNPMDVLVSCYCQNLSFPFCDLEQLALYHHQYERLMQHWENVLPMKIHSVDYESLVNCPESSVRPLLEYLGVPWDERCLDFHNSQRSVHTPSKWQVRQPLYVSSVQKWRRFERHLAPIAELFRREGRDGTNPSFEPREGFATNVDQR